MSLPVLVIDHALVAELLPMAECIEVMSAALNAYSGGACDVPLRSIVWLPDRSGGLGLMPGYLGAPATLGLKVVTVFPKNEGTPHESHQGAVLLFDVENGSLMAVLDACEITAIRTAAASAVATRALARPDAAVLAILGSGTQARTHLEAMRCVRPIRSVRMWSRDGDKARAFIERESTRDEFDLVATDSAEDAVRGADIICTVTGSREPVLEGEWLRPGSHINAVGACIPAARELDSAAIARARLYVDSRESASRESGDYLVPLKEGRIGEAHIVGEIGAVLLGQAPGRTSADEITIYKSLGLAVEDLAAAQHILERARERSCGASVTVGGLRRETP